MKRILIAALNVLSGFVCARAEPIIPGQSAGVFEKGPKTDIPYRPLLPGMCVHGAFRRFLGAFRAALTPDNRRLRRLGRRLAPRIETLEDRLALAAGPVVITELMYHPLEPTAAEAAVGFSQNDFEFIELRNNGSDSASLAGYTLSGGIDFTFPAIDLAAAEYVVVVGNVPAFNARYASTISVAGQFNGTLSNGGESIVLRDGVGTVVLSFAYDDAWQPSTDGGGASLVILDPHAALGSWGVGGSWTASSNSGGSPGQGEGTFDSTPPTAPVDLVATVVSSMRVDLVWQASADAESGVADYRVYRNSSLIATTIGNQYSDTAAIGNGVSTYLVRAVNESSVASAASNTVAANVPPTGASPTFASAQLAGIVATEYRETSGAVGSRTHAGVFYIHEDGPRNSVAAINRHGAMLGIITLTGVATVDTEDIALGPGPVPGVDYLYLGDVGDNDSNRASISVFRIAEPSISAAGGGNQSYTIGRAALDVISLRYPVSPVDAEAMIVDPLGGDLYIFAKDAGVSRVFRAAAASLVDGASVVLEHVGSVPVDSPSAADISPDGREIIVRNESWARLFRRAIGQSVAGAIAGPPIFLPVVGRPTEPNGEAIAFDHQGNNYFTISEGRDPPLYYFHRTSISPSTPTAEPGDLNADGSIDLDDLVILQSNLGESISATPAMGDLNGDGKVDRADAAAFATRFGREAPALPASAAAANAVVRQSNGDASRLVRRRTPAASAIDCALTTNVESEIDARTSAMRSHGLTGKQHRSIVRPPF